jgi:hypothetical protein
MTFPSTYPANDASGGRYGITTTGYGLVSAPATAAHLQIAITNFDFYHGPPQAPRIEAVPGTRARTAMVGIVEAIRNHESVSSVELLIPRASHGYHGPVAVARLDVDVVGPEAGDLVVLLNDAARAAADVDLVVGQVGASFTGADCNQLIREARRFAIANAREQAELQAELLDVSLGDVIASADVQPEHRVIHGMFGPMLAPIDSCAPPLPAGFNAGTGSGIALSPFDPSTQPIQVDAYRRVVMTFAIN